jgi:deazaflavin-dependent oxidoreductase (nitroreductase family)
LTDSGARAPGDIGEELAGWGKVVMLETRGRVTGRPARTAVGFFEEPDGALLVAAGSDAADWARNLEAERRCVVTIGSWTSTALAEVLEGAEHAAAIRELILKYGTPAERLGAGPAFRIRPLANRPVAGEDVRVEHG